MIKRFGIIIAETFIRFKKGGRGMDDVEQYVMELIADGGAARSKAMEAIKSARAGDIANAKNKLKEARQLVSKAHNIQTKLIVNEVSGNNMPVTLLMVHAQDHLMNAMTILDIAEELIVLYDKKF